MRLDIALVERGLCDSRARAQRAIEAGLVSVNGKLAQKPSMQIVQGDEITLQDDPTQHYVGRGALKLLHALEVFNIDVTGLRCLDVGASTGGFTQVLLECGAAHVIAVDVGTGQLAPALQVDSRVLSLEQTDIRSLEIAPVQFACVDVSFISLQLVLPKLAELLLPHSHAVALLKPQFECGPAAVGKRGVVKSPKEHQHALQRVISAAQQAGFAELGVTQSPLLGGQGNTEFLLHLQRGDRL